MGIIQKVNDNNWYQNFDTDAGKFVGEPIRPYSAEIEIVNTEKNNFIEEESIIAKGVTSIDQVSHQLILSEDGRTIDLDEKHFEIVDENGRIEFDADGEKIISIAKDQLTYGNFIKTYRESSSKAMLLLLALQSNATPLKRGGLDIAYMADILLDHMLVKFSEEATVVWEAIAAVQSSKPEDNYFRITADDLKAYTNYKSDEALYHAFKKGAEELKRINLEFDVPDPERDGHNIMVHWNEGAEWVGNNRKTGEKAHFDVYTNDFFRVLMSSSGILHGAHWNRKISRNLKNYARSLYMFCARNKGFTKYKGAIPGIRELTVAEVRYEFKFGDNIETKAITRHLSSAQEKINSLPDSEFTVNIKRIPEKGRIEGYRFEIKENRFIEAEAVEVIEETKTIDAELHNNIKMLFNMNGISFNDDEVERITACAVRNKKNASDLMEVVLAFSKRLNDTSRDKIEDNVSYICRMIMDGATVTPTKKEKQKNNGFNNFKQREYDYDAIEKKLFGH